MCGYKNGYPTVLVTGKWLLAYGFNKGDQLTLSNPAPGSLLMTVSRTAAEMAKARQELANQIAETMIRRRKNAA